MGGVSPETCWAIKKHWNNKFYYTVASCWFFLCDLYYDARIHEHQQCDGPTTCEAPYTIVKENTRTTTGGYLTINSLILANKYKPLKW